MTTFDDQADLLLVRGAALLDQDAAKAGQLAQQILASHPGHLEAGLLLAQAYLRQQQPERAATLLTALATARPEQATVRWELGRLLAELQRGPEATAALEAAVRLEPRLAGAWRELSKLYAAGGEAPGGIRKRFRAQGMIFQMAGAGMPWPARADAICGVL